MHKYAYDLLRITHNIEHTFDNTAVICKFTQVLLKYIQQYGETVVPEYIKIHHNFNENGQIIICMNGEIETHIYDFKSTMMNRVVTIVLKV